MKTYVIHYTRTMTVECEDEMSTRELLDHAGEALHAISGLWCACIEYSDGKTSPRYALSHGTLRSEGLADLAADAAAR